MQEGNVIGDDSGPGILRKLHVTHSVSNAFDPPGKSSIGAHAVAMCDRRQMAVLIVAYGLYSDFGRARVVCSMVMLGRSEWDRRFDAARREIGFDVI